MFTNYFKTAFRNLLKNRFVSLVNIIGLTLGMTGAILLILNIQYLLGYDRFYKDAGRIYQAYSRNTVNGSIRCSNVLPAPAANLLVNRYAGVQSVVRVAPAQNLVTIGEKHLMAHGSYTDAEFVDVFGFPAVAGDVREALNAPDGIVITADFAHSLFGNEVAIGKQIVLDNKQSYMVRGVLQQLPANTDFRFQYLLPWQVLERNDSASTAWSNSFSGIYVKVSRGADIGQLNTLIADVINNNRHDDKHALFLYPLSRVFLYGKFQDGKPAGGRIANVVMLSILAAIILLIACINFMNLSTARSEKRAREVGVRKVMGANKASLRWLFIAESLLLSLLSGVFALLLVQLIVPVFSQLANVRVSLPWHDALFWVGMVAFMLVTGLLAGSYPAFYMSSFQPARVLKGVVRQQRSLLTPRKVLVVVQFVCAVLLINMSVIIKKQWAYAEEREAGFVKPNLVFHPLNDDLKRHFPVLRNELLSSGVAVAVNESSTPVTRGGTGISGLTWEGMTAETKNMGFELLYARQDFVATNGVTLAAGRDINVNEYPSDTASCLINETAARALGFANPVGQVLMDDAYKWTIVGVIKDFVINSPVQASTPMLIMGDDHYNYMNIRLSGNLPDMQVKKAEAIINKYNPGYPTELVFAEDDYERKFREAHSNGQLVNFFALVAIFVSCMGLFGLSLFMAENRSGEISIRKVLGSSVAAITRLLAGDFIKPVLLAVVIASPLSWLLMHSFLQQFSYRTVLSWWVLLFSGLLVVLVAFVTVSYQTIRAAMVKPVKHLGE